MKFNFNFILRAATRLLMSAVFLPLIAAPRLICADQQPAPIQDNSFLVEEAYNQEKGVVQHINTFSYLAQSHDWSYTFTQEWPIKGLRNQLSYTLTAARPGAFATGGAGIGDSLVNYRYQLVGSGETRVAVAPRVTLIFPSGDSSLGRGYGGAGVQTNLPLSVVLSSKWVTHWNAGTTFILRARNSSGNHAPSWSYNSGQSVIWLVKPRFNVMMETYFVRGENVSGPRRTEWSTSVFLNPGIRWAYNFKSGLQIVPGLAIPVGVGPTRGEKGIFVYLSFEHPFRRMTK